MELNGMKRIILEYSSIFLFGNFNGRNGKLISLFGSLSIRKWNGYEGTLISFYSFKTSNFHSPQYWDVWEGMKLDLMILFTKTLKIPLYIQLFILKQGYNSNIFIKIILFHSLYVTLKQDYFTFHSFLFLSIPLF